MIRFFRRYQKTVFGILIFLAALLMISFNVDFSKRGSSKNGSAAITVDDIEIPHAEFYAKRREVENRYRQMLGPQYDMMMKQFNLNVPQGVVDSMIENALLVRDASQRGFQASDDEVVATISKMFPNGYDPSLLRASGKTPDLFLKETEEQIRRAQLEDIIQDSAASSKKEAVALWIKQNTQYDVQYVEIDPKDLLKDIKAPTDDELKKYYDDHTDEFRLPERISYEYVAFKPTSFLKDIEVSEDEVEFYYTDNQSKFENPEQLKLRHMQFLYPKENDPEKMAAVKDKAQQAYNKAKEGADFSGLVLQYSDDFTTRSSGGDLGWVARGKYPKEFDDKTYAVKNGGLAELIETDYGFHVVKVEGYKASSLKPLTEVKEQILQILKNEQAPAYADTKAREFFDLFTKSDKSLTDLAKEKGATAAVTNGLLSEKTDPEAALTGLTAKVLEEYSDDSPKQLIELKDITIIVAIKEHKASEVASLESVKERAMFGYKNAQSINLARAKADALLKSIKTKPGKLLEAAAKDEKISVQKKTAINMNTKLAAPFTNQEVKSTVFNPSSIPSDPQKIFSEGGKFYIVQDINRILPDEKNAKPEELAALRTQNSQSLGTISTKAYSESLKASAKVNVDPSILNSES